MVVIYLWPYFIFIWPTCEIIILRFQIKLLSELVVQTHCMTTNTVRVMTINTMVNMILYMSVHMDTYSTCYTLHIGCLERSLHRSTHVNIVYYNITLTTVQSGSYPTCQLTVWCYPQFRLRVKVRIKKWYRVIPVTPTLYAYPPSLWNVVKVACMNGKVWLCSAYHRIQPALHPLHCMCVRASYQVHPRIRILVICSNCTGYVKRWPL